MHRRICTQNLVWNRQDLHSVDLNLWKWVFFGVFLPRGGPGGASVRIRAPFYIRTAKSRVLSQILHKTARGCARSCRLRPFREDIHMCNKNREIRFSLRFYIKWYIKTTWCVPGDDRHLSPWYSYALSHSGNTFPPSLFGCLSPHKVMWAFPAFLLSNKIRVKYVLGVFDPVESDFDISFPQFLIGYATIALNAYLKVLFTMLLACMYMC